MAGPEEFIVDAIERLRQSPLPFAALLDVRFTSATCDRVIAELIVRADLCTIPFGQTYATALLAS